MIGGGYLLSHFRSTIGVVRFNFSVRNGKRWIPNAIATLVSFSLASAGLSAGGASRSPPGGAEVEAGRAARLPRALGCVR